MEPTLRGLKTVLRWSSATTKLKAEEKYRLENMGNEIVALIPKDSKMLNKESIAATSTTPPEFNKKSRRAFESLVGSFTRLNSHQLRMQADSEVDKKKYPDESDQARIALSKLLNWKPVDIFSTDIVSSKGVEHFLKMGEANLSYQNAHKAFMKQEDYTGQTKTFLTWLWIFHRFDEKLRVGDTPKKLGHTDFHQITRNQMVAMVHKMVDTTLVAPRWDEGLKIVAKVQEDPEVQEIAAIWRNVFLNTPDMVTCCLRQDNFTVETFLKHCSGRDQTLGHDRYLSGCNDELYRTIDDVNLLRQRHIRDAPPCFARKAKAPYEAEEFASFFAAE
jgi:hypothetical protein